jgi:hypothetical protein
MRVFWRVKIEYTVSKIHLPPGILIITHPSYGKLKPYSFPRELLVHLGVSIQSEIHASSLLLVQHHLQHFAPILPRSGTLADNLDGIDDVV